MAASNVTISTLRGSTATIAIITTIVSTTRIAPRVTTAGAATATTLARKAAGGAPACVSRCSTALRSNISRLRAAAGAAGGGGWLGGVGGGWGARKTES